MNLPNKLTVLRVIMIPFFVAALLYDGGANQNMRYVAAALFIIASLTDMLDGKIARKYNLVTNFGKFMDPLADKLLVCSALICMIELRELPLRENLSSAVSVWWHPTTVLSSRRATGENLRPHSR